MQNFNLIMLLSIAGCQPVSVEEFSEEEAIEEDSEKLYQIVFSVKQVTAGDEHSCALTNLGVVKCWGSGFGERLGYAQGNIIEHVGDDEHLSTVGYVSLGAGAVKIDAGDNHTCAILNDGSLRCWGENLYGQLGVTVPADYEIPTDLAKVAIGGKAIDVAAGAAHTCVLLDTGNVRCWGWNTAGQLGYGHKNQLKSPGGNISLGGKAKQIVAGREHTCALLDTGKVRCWGYNASGQLGYANTKNIGDNETPGLAGDLELRTLAVQLVAGSDHTCALLDNGDVRCWGEIGHGELGYGSLADGYGNIGDNETPGALPGVPIGGKVVSLSAGAWHTCAILDTGAAQCWGDSDYGTLGYGDEEVVGLLDTPASAGNILINGKIAQIGNGYQHTCVLMQTGTLRCWGRSQYGQLGYANKATLMTPNNVDLKFF